MTKPATQLVFVGTYTEADSQGIEIYALNSQTGLLRHLHTVGGIPNPSYLSLSPDHQFLYAVNEVTAFDGKPTGTVSAFQVDSVSGALTLLNRVPTHGRAPCYLEISANGRFVLVNNYLDGTAASFPIQPDGRLGKAISIVRENGSGPNKARQNASHVHSITLDPNNHLAITANLGTDRLTVYRFDSNSGKLTPLSGKITHTAPGAGPRHLVFTTDGTCAYVANELNNSVEAFHFNVLTGTLKHFQTIPTVPEDFSGTNYPADIHISPDGKFLYVSNRGAENLAIFSVAPKTGRLAFLATQSVRGSWPRNFALSHDGHLLVVANQKSKTLVVFRRNPYSGFLQWLSTTPTEAFPACVKIADF